MVCFNVFLLNHEKAEEFSKVFSEKFHINLKMKRLCLVGLLISLISCVPQIGDYYTVWQTKVMWESQTSFWSDAEIQIYEPTLVTKSVDEFTNWGDREWQAEEDKVGNTVKIVVNADLTAVPTTFQA